MNDFGLDPASKRCAIVDGLKRPWCFVGSGDADWDYCSDDCGQQDPTPAASAACSITVTGKPCDAWGENDFGLDPASATCEQVDGLDRPWCYTNEEDWDYCNCDRQGARTASAAADQAGAEPVRAKRAIEPGCDDDRAETLALRRQIVELKDNKRALEMRSAFATCLPTVRGWSCTSFGLHALTSPRFLPTSC